MKILRLFSVITFFVIATNLWAENTNTTRIDKTGTISGTITDENGEKMPFTEVRVMGTTIGAATNTNGNYRLKSILPGEVTLKAQSLGYKPVSKTIEVESGKTTSLNFQMERDALGLDEVVITGDRMAKDRKSVTTIVNTISPKIFKMTQAQSFGEGLSFTPGVRMEDNCQNCGFSQVRMNGMEGPYSQILINSRPIFSGLAGVYGLELIPVNMIDKVEVVRGGGSALYGSNAIAGTINIILKDPIANTYEVGYTNSLTGIGVNNSKSISPDNSTHINTSIVSEDNKTGLALYGFWRDRKSFDANDDGYSEMPTIENTTIGTRLFHRMGGRNKIAIDFFNIRENRRGGNKFDYIEHEADIAESLRHDILTGAVSYDQFFREKDLWSIYASGQRVHRNSYYGAEQALDCYGETKDLTYTLGTQYNAFFNKNGSLVAGAEYVSGALKDTKLGYYDIDNAEHVPNTTIADQTLRTIGVFAQYEIKWHKLTTSLGARYENYKITDDLGDADNKSGNVFSPRITLKYDIIDYLQARASYSQGYRAPQIFDEDLHIDTSGARRIIHKNSPNLKQETSHSYMASLNFNKKMNEMFIDFLVEGFYTQLDDAFANEYSTPNAKGEVIYTRYNADEATIKGVNIELKVVPSVDFNLQAGFTLQSSEYKDPQEFNETRFVRTPDDYGYLTLNYYPTHFFNIALTGNYTGKMLVPHNESVLVKSDPFLDAGVKFSYDFHINHSQLRIYAGMKNIFNSYQDDFDKGINRDSAYIYGPSQPRTVYFGITLGNNLK